MQGPLDYNLLADAFPPLKTHLKHSKTTTHIDYKSIRASRDITCAILWAHWNLILEVPLESLIPTVPNRLDYILYIQDLIKNQENVIGIDLGCGHSCIYALLACRLTTWKFIAIDNNPASIEAAEFNVVNNQLEDSIKVVLNTSAELLPFALIPDKCTFVMCNPPFYKSQLEISDCRSRKSTAASCKSNFAEVIEMFNLLRIKRYKVAR